MCGIAGEISYIHRPNIGAISRMNAAMSSRGPDASGVMTMGPATFGHTRLSILDLDPSSNQPMTDYSAGVMISFNGEIYNYKELALELKTLGSNFITKSDTEVIIEAYKKWGRESFKRLNGMFSFGLWDSQNKCFFLVRDRFGKKPAYYSVNKDGFIFASELSALLCHPSVDNSISHSAIRQFLSLNYTLTSNPIIKGVKKLQPGFFLHINSRNELETHQYWDYAYHFLKEKSNISLDEAEEELALLLEDASRIRTRMDVPYCTLLSGGIDSTAVTIALSKECANLNSFTVKFSQKNFDESGEALRIAELLGIKPNLVREEEDILTEYIKMINYIDEPFADSSYLPCASVFSSISRRYKVSITGDGGDEIFAGYETYKADLYNQYLKYIPQNILRQALLCSKKFLNPSYGKLGLDEKLRRLLQGIGKDPLFSHYSWRLINTNYEIRHLFNEEYHPFIEECDPFKDFKLFYDDVRGAELIDSLLYVDAKTWLVDDVLYKMDRSSMMHSVEVRSPLLDYRVAEFMASMPVIFKINFRHKKILLRNFLLKNIPKDFIQKKKQGFNAPISLWAKNQLKDLMYSQSTSELMGSIFKIEQIKCLWSDHLSGKSDNGLKLFGLSVLGGWLDKNRRFKFK